MMMPIFPICVSSAVLFVVAVLPVLFFGLRGIILRLFNLRCPKGSQNAFELGRTKLGVLMASETEIVDDCKMMMVVR